MESRWEYGGMQRKFVRDLLRECNSPMRWIWIDPDTVQFVHELFSEQKPLVVWARITIVAASISMRIECSKEMADYDLFYAERVVCLLRENSIEAELVTGAEQPDRSEFYAPIRRRGSYPFC